MLLQAALLHDTVEDTRTTIDEIRVGFGPEVADLVDWLTAPADAGVAAAPTTSACAPARPSRSRC